MENKQYPIVFHSLEGICQKPDDDSSYFNLEEVKTVLVFVKKILSTSWNGKMVSLSDIGVVSPYRAQCDKIKHEFKSHRFDEITVGTAEIFQGQERPIMIISTVRTGTNLGFVKDYRVRNIQIFSSSTY